jgi:hypothetical protein
MVNGKEAGNQAEELPLPGELKERMSRDPRQGGT